MNSIIYWSQYMSKIGKFYLAATENGLCFMGSPNKGREELESLAKQRFSKVDWVKDDKRLEHYKKEIDNYFNGNLHVFTLPVDVAGTDFQIEVWEALKNIPYGKNVTYSQIASMINKPAAVRAVGTAIGRNPLLISVPCHRVIGKNGSLSGYRGGLEMKKLLLELERRFVCHA